MAATDTQQNTGEKQDNPDDPDLSNELAETVVEIAEHYLGFAAREYLDRQCRLHLEKQLNDIRREDLDDLAMWVENTAPLIMDREDGHQLAEEIFRLKSD